MASSSGDKQQAVTRQVEALNAVHAAFADAEKKDLKRKLAASEQELTTVRADLEETRERQSDVNDVCKRSRTHMHEVHMKLQQGQDSGMTLSREEVRVLISHMIDAHNVMNDIKDPGSSCGGSSWDDTDEDDDEDDWLYGDEQ